MKVRFASAVIVLTAMLGAADPASAGQVIFLVRHAERAPTPAPAPAAAPAPAKAHGMMADDPPLSQAGEQRAAKLAAMLASSGIRHVYTSEYRRTRQTAAPLANALHVTPVMAAASDPGRLVARVKADQGNVLIVGHSDTVPDLLKKLGVRATVTIADGDYDNLFVVFRDAAGKATLTILKY
jgi:broad specificity phosphatase PhoE